MTRSAKPRPTRRSIPAAAAGTREPAQPAQPAGKIATLVALLQSPDGATIAALCAATGWQSHSVRGAMAGTLRRKGHVVTSTRPDDGPRRYRIGAPA
jgi:hypothetical protein